MLIDIIVAEQTDFLKVASITQAIKTEHDNGTNIRYRLIYTGHRNDNIANKHFFDQLKITIPDINLEVATPTETEQFATIMVRYEKVLMLEKPQMVLVVGDNTAAAACTVACKKNGNILVGHIEAGIRSNDRATDREINRVLTDSLTDYFFTTSHYANENLRRSGVNEEEIFFVGNTRIDTLLHNISYLHKPDLWDKLRLEPQTYFMVSLYQAHNIAPAILKYILTIIIDASRGLPIIFPAHASIGKTLAAIGIRDKNLIVTGILDYLHFNYLLQHAKAIVTDSGGSQEEATLLNVPCITLGNTKERLETFNIGSNELITSPDNLPPVFNQLFKDQWKKGKIPYMWDGKSSERIMEVIKHTFFRQPVH